MIPARLERATHSLEGINNTLLSIFNFLYRFIKYTDIQAYC